MTPAQVGRCMEVHNTTVPTLLHSKLLVLKSFISINAIEMAQQLRECMALAGDPSVIPSTHVGQLTTAYYSCSHMHTHTDTQKEKENQSFKESIDIPDIW